MAHFFLKKVTKFVPAVGFGFDSILVTDHTYNNKKQL